MKSFGYSTIEGIFGRFTEGACRESLSAMLLRVVQRLLGRKRGQGVGSPHLVAASCSFAVGILQATINVSLTTAGRFKKPWLAFGVKQARGCDRRILGDGAHSSTLVVGSGRCSLCFDSSP